jgi:uncharacterized OsmC-like protein
MVVSAFRSVANDIAPERSCLVPGAVRPSPSRPPSSTLEGTTEGVWNVGQIEVRYEAGDRLSVRIREHELVADQPVPDGGDDAGPSPTELFVAGLAACVGFYAERYLRRHSLPVEGLAVACDFAFAKDRPARVGSIDLWLMLPEGFPEDRRAGLLAVVEHCTVHTSIRQPPEISIALTTAQPVA